MLKEWVVCSTSHALGPDTLSPHTMRPRVCSPHALSPDTLSPHTMRPRVCSPHALSPIELGNILKNQTSIRKFFTGVYQKQCF